MNELSLFTGAGGGLLGTKLLGFNHIGYVEINEYCQKIIAQRIKDGIFDEAPIFTDVREFLQSGAAEQYRGFADVVTAGFPCQPFSVAGKRQGEDDERNMWPATIDVIRTVRPRFALLENVPGLLAHEYVRTIFRGLAESGYSARWDILGASDVGAPHRRKRLWIIAYAKGINGENIQNPSASRYRSNYGELGRVLSDKTSRANWWIDKSGICRVHDGVPNRCNRLKALGNGQVPYCVVRAWQILCREL